MGESAAETVREIEQVRGELDEKVRELDARLPAPAALAKRIVGLAVGGGVGSTAFWFAVKRLRKRRGSKKQERAQANGQVNVIEFSLPELDENTRTLVLSAGAVWLVLRLAQIRENRRTNKLLRARVLA